MYVCRRTSFHTHSQWIPITISITFATKTFDKRMFWLCIYDVCVCACDF